MSWIWLILCLPIISAGVCSLYGGSLGKRFCGFVSTVSVGVSFLLSLLATRSVWLSPDFMVEGSTEGARHLVEGWILWSTQDGMVTFDALVDPLSATLLLLITGVGTLVHWYSLEYMKDDPDFRRYFVGLNLFVAAMVLLVLGSNLVTLLMGWAGVGYASYALIGFWYTKESAILASRKAFVLNTIGDVGIILAIITCWFYEVPLDFARWENYTCNSEVAFLIGCFLLVGAYAKSAQLPLHAWLPDAMEGPTPVSALLHAATMVTAGVYLLLRCHEVIVQSPSVMYMIAVSGAVTAIFAAVCALFQSDLKRVLAYSTMSQLGYMFMAAGAGAYSAALFHLYTHAFFKALLFLVAGIIIHAVHGEQDMRKMGGLAKQMPSVAFLYGIGCIGLSGIFPLAGYWSKEAILLGVELDKGFEPGVMLHWVGMATAVLTSFYIGRSFFLVFFSTEKNYEDLHLPGFNMLAPCMILAGLTISAGLTGELVMYNFWSPILGKPLEIHLSHTWLSQVFLLVAVGLAFFVYYQREETDWTSQDGFTQKFLRGGWRLDCMLVKFSKGLVWVAQATVKNIERLIGGDIPRGIALLTDRAGDALGMMQSGMVRHYILAITASTAMLILFVMLLVGGGS